MGLLLKVKKIFVGIFILGATALSVSATGDFSTECSGATFPKNFGENQVYDCQGSFEKFYFESLLDHNGCLARQGEVNHSSYVSPPINVPEWMIKKFYVDNFFIQRLKNKNLTIEKYSDDNGFSPDEFKGWVYRFGKNFCNLSKSISRKDQNTIRDAWVKKYFEEKVRNKNLSVKKYVDDNGLALKTFYKWLRKDKKDLLPRVRSYKVHTLEEKQRYIREYIKENSGGKIMTLDTFARSRGLKRSTFYTWLKRHSELTGEDLI